MEDSHVVGVSVSVVVKIAHDGAVLRMLMNMCVGYILDKKACRNK